MVVSRWGRDLALTSLRLDYWSQDKDGSIKMGVMVSGWGRTRVVVSGQGW